MANPSSGGVMRPRFAASEKKAHAVASGTLTWMRASMRWILITRCVGRRSVCSESFPRSQCTMLTAIAGVTEDVVCSFPGMNRVPKRTPIVGFQLYSIAGAKANECREPELSRMLG